MVCASLEIHRMSENIAKMTLKGPQFKGLMISKQSRICQGKAHSLLTCCMTCSRYHLPFILCKIISVERNILLINEIPPHMVPHPWGSETPMFCFLLFLHKYSLSSYYVPRPVLSVGDTKTNTTGRVPILSKYI